MKPRLASSPSAEHLPENGVLPEHSANGASHRDFGVYVHVPFCRVRCGYCDFNTYTATELRGVSQQDFFDLASAEIAFAGKALRASGILDRPVSTVFFGGGTPTLLPAEELVRILHSIDHEWGIAPGAEVTTEANPDSVDGASLEMLRNGGMNRISIGMKSAVDSVLATLDRTHDPNRVGAAARTARELEFQVSLDLIYGTPGETLDDWKRSVDAALSCEPDHLSAYSLIVEPGTQMARRVERGELAAPDPDLQADMYAYLDDLLTAEGYSWYEVSNWSRGSGTQSRHNLSYWTSEDWWGIGPGAHSHVGGVRWWNVKHPAPYADRIRAGVSPAHEREVLSPQQQQLETILLRIRLASGLPVASLSADARLRVAELIAEELVDAARAFEGTLVLTQRGRLLTDTVVRKLTPEALEEASVALR